MREVAKALTARIEAEKVVFAKNLEADYKKRIFQDGKNEQGSDIGTYSTTPTYVSILGSKKRTGSQVDNSGLKGIGKTGQTKRKDGSPHKSMYLPQGYSEYRSVVGRQNTKVDFNLTGNLQRQIGVGTTDTSIVLGFIDTDARELATSLEARFGQVFGVTDEEEEGVIIAVERAMDEIVDSIFGR